MDRLDCVVIGAGVVGLAVARALALAGREVVVLEKESGIGTGVSSRNSEVIHAGLYYETGSLKARLCVRGKELLYALCEEQGVDFSRCGKLVVATDVAQDSALRALSAVAHANGVPVEHLDAAGVHALEPELRVSSGLLSPTTGVVDSHGFMLALQGGLEQAGGMIGFTTRVVQMEVAKGSGIVLRTTDPTGAQTEVLANNVVNASALSACALARSTIGMPPECIPREFFAKGSYFALAGKAPFRHLIYPAPSGAWLGVHLTLDLGGQAKFGPDLEWLDTRDQDQIDYRVDLQRAEVFYDAVRRYWPGLPDGALQPSYSGVRPKIYGPDSSGRVPAAPDFLIQGPGDHGVPGLINLFGIESPGLTSSMAIGEYVQAMLGVSGQFDQTATSG